mmetsp:Transcript_2889/g.3225  ORF Transcript_2889/g.3225 Transcript_2889/m.3225 type:complete len:315 (+) Transcript_2889:3-947(+)
MDTLRQLQNFQGLMQVYTGINKPVVQGLQKLWKDIPGKYLTILNTCYQLMTQDHSSLVYRNTLKDLKPPCVPYQRIILSDLTVIEEEPDYIRNEGKIVNWEKMSCLGLVFSDILKCQKVSYKFKSNKKLLEYLGNITVFATIAYNQESLLQLLQISEAKSAQRQRKKSSSPQPKLLKFHLSKLVQNKDLYNKFRAFLATKRQESLLDFLMQVNTYYQTAYKDKPSVCGAAKRIFRTFIDDNKSDSFIQFNRDITSRIKSNMRDVTLSSRDIFKEATTHVKWQLKNLYNAFIKKKDPKRRKSMEVTRRKRISWEL